MEAAKHHRFLIPGAVCVCVSRWWWWVLLISIHPERNNRCRDWRGARTRGWGHQQCGAPCFSIQRQLNGSHGRAALFRVDWIIEPNQER